MGTPHLTSQQIAQVSALVKATLTFPLTQVCQKASRRRRGAFVRWNALDEMLPRLSNKGQLAAWQGDTLFAMGEDLRILKVEKDGEDGLIVTFSDGTRAGYVVEELLLLRPRRERVEEPPKSDRSFTLVTKTSFSMGGPSSK